jgi:hypothetical protein
LASKVGGDTFVNVDYFSRPDKWKRTSHREADGGETLLFVLNGDNLWAREPGKKVQAMPLPAPNMRQPATISLLDNLRGLRESKDSLVVGPPEEAAGRSLVPLTVLSNGRPWSTTYFDRSTNLIVKEKKYYVPDTRDPPESWTTRGPVESETTYGDYKSFEGVTLPTHMVASQAGKTVFDVSVLKVEFPPKFDPHTFDKPRDE